MFLDLVVSALEQSLLTPGFGEKAAVPEQEVTNWLIDRRFNLNRNSSNQVLQNTLSDFSSFLNFRRTFPENRYELCSGGLETLIREKYKFRFDAVLFDSSRNSSIFSSKLITEPHIAGVQLKTIKSQTDFY
jgi:hypothetical protein